MNLQGCAFQTERLLVRNWHALRPSAWRYDELATVVAALLSGPVTRTLPESWQGSYTIERAQTWIEERDREGVTLLVVEKASQQAIGLVILLGTSPAKRKGGGEVRLGYLLSEASWGRGLASELVAGFIRWCREQERIASIVAGVAKDNPTSARVLTKNGFQLDTNLDDVADDEHFYRLHIR